MAQFRQAPIATGLSDFRGNTGDPGSGFRALASILDTAYQTMKPAALEALQRRGAEVGSAIAADQTQGSPRVGGGSMSNPGPQLAGVSESANAAMARLQAATGQTFDITSGYRDPAHNAAVGGAKHSQHMNGNAFDISTAGMSQADIEKLIVQARGAGFGGVGVYDGSLHFDVGAQRAWGPSYHSDSIPAWAQAALGTPVAGAPPGTAQPGQPAPDQSVMMRDADGNLVKKLWSPMSGEFGQVFNAAASTAYLADVMLKGSADLMSLSSQFPLDPQGFQQAATAYANDMIKKAPTPFKADIAATLKDEVGKRFLGMVSEVQNDTQQRAINSTTALVDKWGNDYAQAVATGDPAAIAAAKANLDAALRAKESLPGVYWTPEQSANEVTQREAQGVKAAADASTAQSKVFKDQLKTVIAGAEAGGTSAYDGILSDPNVKAAQPDLWAEAMAKRTFANNTPGFMAMTPADQAAAVAGLKGQPITDTWQTDVPKAAAELKAASDAGWKADPIAYAGQVLPNKPPAIVPFNLERPQDFINSLAARVAYSKAIEAAGYPTGGAVLSKEEAAAIGVAIGKGQDPMARAMIAGAIASAAGKDAIGVFNQIKTDDKTVIHAGKLLASHGDPAAAVTAMRGQALLDDGLVQPPSKADSIAAVSGDIGSALAAAPGAFGAEADILAFAKAYYAGIAPRGTDPTSEAAQAYMEAAVQAAMGQTTVYRDRQNMTVGGVQDVNGSPVLLPMDVAGVDVEAAFKKFQSGAQIDSVMGTIPASGPDLWAKVGGAPMLGGQALTFDDLDSATIFPIRDGVYGLTIMRQGQPVDARDASGGTFSFDLHKFIEAAQ